MNTDQQIALAMLITIAGTAVLTAMGAFLCIAMAWSEWAESSLARRLALSGHAASGREFLRRAIRLRCPSCGEGRIFQSYFRMNQRCSGCGSAFWVNEGEWLGPLTIDWTIASGFALIVWTWTLYRGDSEAWQIAISSAAVVASEFVIMPWSRSFWTLFLFINGEMGTRSARVSWLRPRGPLLLPGGAPAPTGRRRRRAARRISHLRPREAGTPPQ
jgi:uncharacterized protein (DUF983 family)